MLVTLALISGIGLGSMYGLLALGFYVTYAVSNTVNFAQGSSMMLGAVFAYTFAVTWHWNPALAALHQNNEPDYCEHDRQDNDELKHRPLPRDEHVVVDFLDRLR